jgi:hypothetical protein
MVVVFFIFFFFLCFPLNPHSYLLSLSLSLFFVKKIIGQSSFPSKNDTSVVLHIVQEDHVDIVTHLLPRFDASAQAFVCHALLQLATNSLRNKATLLHCRRHALVVDDAEPVDLDDESNVHLQRFSVLERLCDVLSHVDDVAFEPMLLLVVELGSFSFSVAALKRYLFTFSKPSSLTLVHYHRLFDTLRAVRARTAVQSAQRPTAHFDMDAARGGAGLRVAVREPQKAPSNFSIECWLRLEAPALAAAAAPLVALLSRRREPLIALTLNRGRVQLSTGGGEPCTAPKPLEPHRWYHVVVTHSSQVLRASTAHVYVDGAVVVPKASIKGGSSSKGREWLVGCGVDDATLAGQLALVRVYADTLDAAQIASYYARGPNDLAGDAAASPIAVWHAKAARERATVIDVSSGGAHNAVLLPNTLVVGGMSLATAIECAGGTKIFLPLLQLLQADLPAELRHRVQRKSVVLSRKDGTATAAAAAAAPASGKDVDPDAIAEAAAAAEAALAREMEEKERRRSSFAVAVLKDTAGDARILLALLELLREVLVSSTLLATATGAALTLAATTSSAPSTPSAATIAERSKQAAAAAAAAPPKKRRRFGRLLGVGGGKKSSSASSNGSAAEADTAAPAVVDSVVDTSPVSESLEDEAVVQMSALLGVLGRLLSDVTPKQMRPRVIPALEAIADEIAAFDNETLTVAAYGSLVLNASLWKNADFETQKAFIANFERLSREKHELVRSVVPIDAFMAMLRLHFTSDDTGMLRLNEREAIDGTYADERDADGITRAVSEAVRSRVRGEQDALIERRNRLAANGQLHELRLQLLDCLEPLLGREFTDVDVEPIIVYLHDCEDSVGVSDLLFKLGELLATPSDLAVQLAAAIGELDGLWAFVFQILNAPYDAARSLATRCLTRLLQRMPSQYARSDTPHPMLVFGEMMRDPRKQFGMHVYGAAVELLTDTPVDIVPDPHESAAERAYRTSGVSLLHALTTMIERNRRAATKRRVKKSKAKADDAGADAEPYDETDAEQFGERIAIVAGLLQGLHGGEQDDTCQMVLQDLAIALDQHRVLANAIFSQLGWQDWFITLWTAYHGTDVPALALDCMVVLLKHGLAQPNGWMLLEDTQTYFLAHSAKHAGEPAAEHARAMERRLYAELFKGLRPELQRLARDLTDARSADEKRAAKASAAAKAAAERAKKQQAAAKRDKKSGGKKQAADDAADVDDDDDDDDNEGLLTTWSNFVNMVALIEEKVFCGGPLERDERGAWRDFDLVEQLLADVRHDSEGAGEQHAGRDGRARVVARQECVCDRAAPLSVPGARVAGQHWRLRAVRGADWRGDAARHRPLDAARQAVARQQPDVAGRLDALVAAGERAAVGVSRRADAAAAAAADARRRQAESDSVGAGRAGRHDRRAAGRGARRVAPPRRPGEAARGAAAVVRVRVCARAGVCERVGPDGVPLALARAARAQGGA